MSESKKAYGENFKGLKRSKTLRCVECGKPRMRGTQLCSSCNNERKKSSNANFLA